MIKAERIFAEKAERRVDRKDMPIIIPDGNTMSVKDPKVNLRKWKETENVLLISLRISDQLWSLR